MAILFLISGVLAILIVVPAQGKAFSPLVPIGVPTPDGDNVLTTNDDFQSVNLEVHSGTKKDPLGIVTLHRPIIIPSQLYNAPNVSSSLPQGPLARPAKIEAEKQYLTEEEPPPVYQEPSYSARGSVEVSTFPQEHTATVRDAITKAQLSLDTLDQLRFELAKELEKVSDMRRRLHTRIVAAQIHQEIQSAGLSVPFHKSKKKKKVEGKDTESQVEDLKKKKAELEAIEKTLENEKEHEDKDDEEDDTSLKGKTTTSLNSSDEEEDTNSVTKKEEISSTKIENAAKTEDDHLSKKTEVVATDTETSTKSKEDTDFLEKITTADPPSFSFILSKSFPSAPSPVVAEFDAKTFEKELENILKPTHHQKDSFLKIH